jgi:hypothetical protein
VNSAGTEVVRSTYVNLGTDEELDEEASSELDDVVLITVQNVE